MGCFTGGSHFSIMMVVSTLGMTFMTFLSSLIGIISSDAHNLTMTTLLSPVFYG
jgi:sorbitol-specific phosphotransferase system component IIBC